MPAVVADLMQPTRYTTWRPSWRLHLAHMVMALGVTFVSIAMTWPLSDITVLFGIAGGLALALCSRFPWPGAALGAAVTWAGTVVLTDVPLSPGIIPWLCTAILVARASRACPPTAWWSSRW